MSLKKLVKALAGKLALLQEFKKKWAVQLSAVARSRKKIVSMSFDSVSAMLCLWLAYSLRYGELYIDFFHNGYFFPIIGIVSVICFSIMGVYRWIVRSTNQRLVYQLIKGSVLSSVCLLVLFFLLETDKNSPRSIFILFGILLAVTTAGVRLFWRSIFLMDRTGEPIAIYGAGDAGNRLATFLKSAGDFRPILFIDDDINLSGTTLAGLPVHHSGGADMVARLKSFDIDRIVITMPRLSSADYHRKLSWIKNLDLGVLTTPSMEDLLSGKASAHEIRDVSIADILGRSEVSGNDELMKKRVSGKVVLVTGGGGSIGSELCRQILRLDPEHLVILDNSEANLYQITEELAAGNPARMLESANFTPLLGSVLDKARINRLMAEYHIDTIFHAAAYKHVPIVEAQPDQGVNVNVFGTQTVLESAIVNGASDFVLISTDKAVRPTNSMGASKRVAELILQAWASEKSRTRISMVRFGNVLGSSGSVVPKFKKQILEGGPITLTHKSVTRFFMTIPEAAQLVLQASSIAEGGEVFVLDMGEPIKIEELAETMVRLYGKKLRKNTNNDRDIEIVVDGLRPGEKMYEEMFITDDHERTSVSKIFCAFESKMELSVLRGHLNRLEKHCESGNLTEVRNALLRLSCIDSLLHRSEKNLVDNEVSKIS